MAEISANGSRGHHNFALTVTQNEDLSISFNFVISSLGGGWDWFGWGSSITYKINIHNKSYSGTMPDFDGYTTTILKSDTLTIDADVINISFSVTDTTGQTYTCGNASASGTMEIETGGKLNIMVDGEWKKAKVYIGIDGEWKKAKPYFGVDGVWKKGK